MIFRATGLGLYKNIPNGGSMQSRNQLQGEQLADKIIQTVKIHLADFEGSQLDQLLALLEAEVRERDELGNTLEEYNKGEIINDSLGNRVE